MHVVNMHEAKTHLSRLVEAAANGEPFVIERAGKPVVKVVAVDAPAPGASRQLGFLAGRISVPSDFDRLGAGDVEALFEHFPVLLVEAFHDLHQVVEEAREQDFPEPSEVATRNAAGLLRQMFALSSRRYEIYPTPDGEVAIDAPDGHGQSVLVLCSSSGGVLCLVNMKAGHRRARYSSAANLPDGFVREALADLDRQDH